MKIFYLQLQSNRHICPYTSIVDKNFLSTIEIVEVVELLDLLGSVCNLGQKLTDRDCITLRRRAHLEPS